MPTALEALKEFKTKRDALNKEIEDSGKRLFGEVAATIFENHPTLVSFSWKQYTPHWNDGDTCEFSAHTEYIQLRTNDDPEINEDDDSEEKEFDKSNLFDYSKDYRTKTPKASLTPREAAGKDVLELLENFDEDSLQTMFGDHAKVIVTKGGVEVEEYDHD